MAKKCIVLHCEWPIHIL